MFSGLQQVKRTLSRSECFSVLLGRARGIVGRVGVEKKTRVGMWGLGNNADMLINMLLARFHVLASFTGGGGKLRKINQLLTAKIKLTN